MRDMMRQFFEEIQVQFVLFREAEKSFVNSLIDVVQEFLTMRSKDDTPEQLLAVKAANECFDYKNYIYIYFFYLYFRASTIKISLIIWGLK
jgi:hypothetical protein